VGPIEAAMKVVEGTQHESSGERLTDWGGIRKTEERIQSMIGHMNLEVQVDADFSNALRRALLRQMRTHSRRDNASEGLLLCFDDLGKIPWASARVYRGTRTVPVSQIGGSVGRCSEFDGDFMPVKAGVKVRWKRIDRAFHRGEELPPVSLYKVGGFYFVLDGHHRLSVASYHGVEWIDAEVTEFGAAGLRSDRRDRDSLTERSREGDLRVHEVRDFQLAKHRREELLREAELNRQVKALRATGKRGAGRRSALVWEIKRQAGVLLKILSTLRNAG